MNLTKLSPLLIIGSGRLARHLDYYFRSLNIPVVTWSRKSSASLAPLLKTAKQAWVLIPDHAIEGFINEHADNFKGQWVHCSGALYLENAVGAHPLMTFGPNPYELNVYAKIAFGIDRKGLSLPQLIPQLKNPWFFIEPSSKTLYHAICSMSGNFTTILWQSAFDLFQKEFKMPQEYLFPYLNQIAKNLMENPKGALTGPMARGDWAVVDKHMQTLEQRPDLLKIYKTFSDYYKHQKGLDV